MTAGQDAASASWPRSRILRISLTAVAAALLALAVVRAAAMNAFAAGDATMASLVAADDPRIMLAGADAAVREARGDVGAGVEQRAIEAARRLPLNETPFLIAGARALGSGDLSRAERLLTEARARNPRSRTARFLLLELYVRAGRAHRAAEEMATLTRLVPNARPLLVAGLARFAQSFRDGGAMARVLEDDPAIRDDVLDRLAALGEEPELIAAVANGAALPADAEWPRYLIDALVDRGDVRRAHAYWRRLAGLSADAAPAVVFNPRFDDIPAPPPFNWSFADVRAGAARPGAGLAVEYRGGERVALARQLLLLPAGAYRLSFQAEGETIDKDGELVWTLACRGSAAPLASVPVEAALQIPKSTEAAFIIPDTCPAQWLTLVGLPGGAPETISLTLSDFEIARSDAP